MAGFGGMSGAFGQVGGAVSDIFGAVGDWAEAKSYSDAARLATQNAGLTQESTRLQEYQASRQITQTIGAQQSQVAGAGFESTGTATDLMRSSVQQGELTKQLVQINGQVQANGYVQEAAAYRGEEAAAKAAAQGGMFGGIMKGIGAVASIAMFSDYRLKSNIIYSRPTDIDGIALYTFQYNGGTMTYEGVIAQEVLAVRPDCVEVSRDGFLKVNYGKLGIGLRIVGEA